MNSFYKESKSKINKKNIFFFFVGGGARLSAFFYREFN